MIGQEERSHEPGGSVGADEVHDHAVGAYDREDESHEEKSREDLLRRFR